MISLYLNIAIIIYQGSIKPLDSRYRNNNELFNEIIVDIATIHLIFFTDWVGNEEE